MHLHTRSYLLTSLALAVLSAAPALASAQSSVIILGIRSVEGDDEFARNLTGALRHAASQTSGWNVSDREVTLDQMALAHGCDDPDPTCLEQMAQSLTVDRIVYGDVRRTSAGGRYDFSVNLHVFNAETNQIENVVTDTIASIHRDIDHLREPARRYIAALSGLPRTGTLRIQVNVPGAEVFVDGEWAGVAGEDGTLVLSEVPAGNRRVRVLAPGHQSFTSTVSVEAYGEAAFEAELEVGGSEPFPTDLVAGIGLLVGAAGLAAAWIGTWAHLKFGLEEDQLFTAYREAVYMQRGEVDNVCDGIHAMPAPGEQRVVNRARAICSEAAVLEPLQFVFGIGAAAAAGVGTYFLIRALGGEEAASEQAFRLTPSLGPDHAYLGLTGSF